MGQQAEPRQAASSDEAAAISFCEDLARTLGPAYWVSLYRILPPELVRSWGTPRRAREDPVPALLAEGGSVVNRAVGRTGRISLLPVPGGSGYALAVEPDARSLGRAARVLASLADPDGSAQEPSAHLGDALEQLVAAAVERMGVPIGEMSRSQKQQVVKFLDERGAFLIKKAVEDVATRLEVSRFTIYNYLEEGKS